VSDCSVVLIPFPVVFGNLPTPARFGERGRKQLAISLLRRFALLFLAGARRK